MQSRELDLRPVVRKHLLTPKSTLPGSSASLPSVPAGLEPKVDHLLCVVAVETFDIFSLFSCSSSQTISLQIGQPK